MKSTNSSHKFWIYTLLSYKSMYLKRYGPFSCSEWSMQKIKIAHVKRSSRRNTLNFSQDSIYPNESIIVTFHDICSCHILNLQQILWAMSIEIRTRLSSTEKKKKMEQSAELTPYSQMAIVLRTTSSYLSIKGTITMSPK